MEIPEKTLFLIGHNMGAREKKYDKAIEILDYCIELYPESPQAHNALGKIYKLKKDFILSRKHYKQAIKLAAKKSMQETENYKKHLEELEEEILEHESKNKLSATGG